MERTFATKATRVLIAEEGCAVRQLLSETMRGLGFREITVVATGKDVFNAMEHDDCDWIIMPTFIGQAVTAFHVLKALCEIPRLREIRISLLVDKDDERYLAPAFHYGLLSWHSKVYVQKHLETEMNKFFATMKANNWITTLVAAEYFRSFVNVTRKFEYLLDVEKQLLEIFPGSLPLLIRYGEAQLRTGNIKEGTQTLQQACLIDEQAKSFVSPIIQKYTDIDINLSSNQSTGQNVLGIKSCVLIDPDTAVLGTLKKLLSQAGVPQIETFENGQDAWEWLRQNPEPDLLLQEWRIPGLPGPLLLQRIRHHGFINVPVNVISSVIKPEESHLLREFGVSNVIAKPFAPYCFFKSLVWTIQQNIYPTEQNSLQQKIKRLLLNNQLAEAERLKETFLADPMIKLSCKKTVEAHFAFTCGNYRMARDTAMEALRLQGDSLCLLNLIGKCLLKLGDYAAAVKVFEKAHSMSQMNIETLCLLAIAQHDCGQKVECEASLAKARDLDASNEMIGETDCQIALLDGDVSKAKDLMEELSSVHQVLAYMNNRAVSLTRSGRFDDGIKLYQRTIESIPSRLADAKDAVIYNLGLAFARYGDLHQAMESLTDIASRIDSRVHRKSLSLMKRVKDAVERNVAVPFYDTITDGNNVSAAEIKGAQGATESSDDGAVAICLFGIYSDPDLTQWESLFDNFPKFIDKSSQRTLAAQGGL